METIAPFRLTVCGIEELAGFCPAGASHVLSILDPEWPVPEAFGAFGEHQKLELRFHDIIEETPGQILPREEHVAAVLAFGRDLMREPREDAHLLVHCHAGISRSSASMTLILAQFLPDSTRGLALGFENGLCLLLLLISEVQGSRHMFPEVSAHSLPMLYRGVLFCHQPSGGQGGCNYGY